MKIRFIIFISLIILASIVIVLRTIRRSNSQPSNGPQTTIIPTLTPAVAPRPATTQVKQAIQQAINTSPPEERARVLEFAKKLPYETPDFYATYDTDLGVILISLRNVQAYQPVKQFLRTEGVLDAYLRGSPLFIVSTNSLEKMRTDIRNEDIYEFEEKDSDTWIRKLPIQTTTYVIDYDVNSQTFVAQITTTPEQEDEVRASIITQLRAIGVPVDKYTITYTVTNP